MRNKLGVKLIIVTLIFLFTFEGCSTTPEINNTLPYLLELHYMWGGEGRNFYFDVNPIKKQPEIRKIFTGEPLKWFFNYNREDITYTPFFASPPVFYKDVLYFEDTGGFYYAIDVKTGKIKWKQDIDVDPNRLNPSFVSPPLIIDNIVFFAGGPLYGLDINSGKIVYKQDIGTINAPGFKDGIIYLSTASQIKRTATVVGIDVTKGKIVSKRILDKLACIEAPLFYKDSVIVYDKCSGNIYSLDLKTLNLKWEIKQHDNYPYSASISNNKLILVRWVLDLTPLKKMQCVVIDPENGKILWEVSFEDEEREEDKNLIIKEYGNIFYSFVVSDGNNIYFGNNEGFIYAVDSTGKLLWKIKTEPLGSIPAFTRNVPVISKDTLYIVTTERHHSGYLYAIDTKTSKILFKHHLPARAEYPVTVADNKIYVTSGLQIFELKN
jgi:outer membrane protein assembly factor BamB